MPSTFQAARFDETAPVYLQISRDGLVLHLSEHHGDDGPGSTVTVQTTGLEDYHREITAKSYRFMRPGIELAPWNAKDRLRFNEPIEPRPR